MGLCTGPLNFRITIIFEDYTVEVLISGLFLFFIPHIVSIVNHRWRDRVAARIGESANGLGKGFIH